MSVAEFRRAQRGISGKNRATRRQWRPFRDVTTPLLWIATCTIVRCAVTLAFSPPMGHLGRTTLYEYSNHNMVGRRKRPFVDRTKQEPTVVPASLFSTTAADTSDLYEYLGSGPEAIVREGCVLVAPLHEFNHYLFKSAVYIFEIGHDENMQVVVRGVVLDNPTPFTLEEMTGATHDSLGPLGTNLIFRGGGIGNEAIVWFHGCCKELSSSSNGEKEIGTSGVQQGRSLPEAVELLKTNEPGTTADNFKFFFNYVEFREQELEDILKDVQLDDAWVSLQVPSEMVLDNDYDKNDCWTRLRNYIQQRAR